MSLKYTLLEKIIEILLNRIFTLENNDKKAKTIYHDLKLELSHSNDVINNLKSNITGNYESIDTTDQLENDFENVKKKAEKKAGVEE